jgi:hypothetical protein
MEVRQIRLLAQERTTVTIDSSAILRFEITRQSYWYIIE